MADFIPPAAIRRAIADQVCPWCKAGPFAVLSLHTYQAHGVAADELRDRAELNKKAPTCSAEYSAKHREPLIGLPLVPKAYSVRRAPRPRRNFSKAGLEAQRRGLAEGKRRADAERQRARRSRYLALGGGWQAVERCATEWGVSAKTARQFLRDAGCEIPDGRQVSPKRLGIVRNSKPKVPCSDASCDRDAICRGMCRMHYQRWQRRATN